MEQRDLIIIGGGPAGYVAAIRATQLKGKVTLIEKDALGGTCLNRGCIPTRALLRGVEFLDLSKKAKDYGINFGTPEIDFSKLMARKDIIVRTVVGGVELLMRENGVEVLKGKGKLLSSSEVEVQLEDGTTRRLTAPKILIATGSSSKVPAAYNTESTITTDQALELKEVPRSVLVVGGGAIAFAFATIFSKLGTAVVITEQSSRVLPQVDREIVSLLERELKKEKVRLYTEAYITKIADGPEDEKNIVLSVKGQETALTAQYVLRAEDREPNIDGLGLDGVQVKVESGGIAVNQKMETNIPGIFAAGDVTGEQMLAHVAFAEGKVAAENALGKDSEIDYVAVPRCINTTPEIASVGITEEEALAQGYQIKVGKFPFAANGMATILGERTGMIKVITEAKYGQILGVHILGPHAADLIAEVTLAMKLDATPYELGSTIHIHPSLSEALMEAALDVTGETLHFLPANR